MRWFSSIFTTKEPVYDGRPELPKLDVVEEFQQRTQNWTSKYRMAEKINPASSFPLSALAIPPFENVYVASDTMNLIADMAAVDKGLKRAEREQLKAAKPKKSKKKCPTKK